MKALAACTLAASLLTSHAIAHDGAAPRRSFNQSAFVGLVSPQVTTYEAAVLDYDLQSPAGKDIHFKSCVQVETAKEGEIAESQYALFKLLFMNCLALKRYAGSANARQSFFLLD